MHLLVWDVAKRRVVADAYHPAVVSAALWASNGRICSGADDGFLYLWDFREGVPKADAMNRPAARFPALGARQSGHHRRWLQIAPASGGDYLAAADDGGSVFCFDLLTGQSSMTVSEAAGVVLLGSMGDGIFTCRSDGQSGRIRRERSKVLRTVSSQRVGLIRDFDVTPDGSLIATGGEDFIIKVWKVQGLTSPNKKK